jgi:hypothetical protein
MKSIERLGLILIFGAVQTSWSFLTIAVHPQAAIGLEREDVNMIAEKITVMIDGPDDDQINKGSGVIVRREGNIYYVITNKHVVEKEGDYQLQTVDGTRYLVNYRQIQKLPGLDLAVVQFISDKNYRVVKLGDSDRVSRHQKIYVVGYATPGAIFTSRLFISASGSILGRVPDARDGYALVYNLNIIQPGMSGGPVLDDRGQLIGINGLAQFDARTGRTDLIAGIPTNSFSSKLIEIVPVPTERAAVTPPATFTTSRQFFCGISNDKPATMVRTSRGNIPLILWSDADLASGLSPQQRCEKISARFENLNQSGHLKFITTGTVNGIPVLCAVPDRNSYCSENNILTSFQSETEANEFARELYQLNASPSEPPSNARPSGGLW